MVLIKKILKWMGIVLGTSIIGAIALWQALIALAVVIIFVVMGIAAFLPEHRAEKTQENSGGVSEVYSDGRKTIESFGARKEFAILRGVRVDDKGSIVKNTVRWSLYGRDKNETIDYDIECYERISSFVYTNGSKGYTKLNFETGEIQQSKDLNVFSKEDQEIFKNLKQCKN